MTGYENCMQMYFPQETIKLTRNTHRNWTICSYRFVFVVPVNEPYY